MKNGLVMEGGAMRGMFTCGILDVFMEEGVEFDAAAGISAGAVFGCNFKSRQIGRPLRYNKRFCNDSRYCSFRNLIKTGDLYEVNFCYHELPDVLDPFDRAAFAENPMLFYIGATDVETGECVYHLCNDGGTEDIEWMRASASMPIVSKPVPINGRLYLDGGMTDSVPYRFMEQNGYKHNVIVLTQPADYRKKKGAFAPLVRFALRKYPAMAKAMNERYLVYNKMMEEITQREKAGTSLVLRPKEALGISRTEKNPDELERVYQLGRECAKERLDEIKRFLMKD